jgi:glycosyltransferase involved in cell wall biosynthesis
MGLLGGPPLKQPRVPHDRLARILNETTPYYDGQIAVLIPCYNEEITIGKVIDDFARELPEARIYVYDNNSTDETAAIAREHGAIVKLEPRQGKGNVLRQMFRDIDADYYVLVDGDDTYPADAVHELLRAAVEDKADMVVGDRHSNLSYQRENSRQFHNFGNNLVKTLIHFFYGTRINDVLSGYRVFTKLFVKTFPVLSRGFEIETEMSIHAIDKNWRIYEVPIEYRDRPEGSESKLSTVKDGVKVLLTILSLFKDYKPLILFCLVALVMVVIGLIIGISVVIEFLNTGLVERFPSAILAVAFIIIGMLALVCGLILDTIVKGYRKQYELDVIREYMRGEALGTSNGELSRNMGRGVLSERRFTHI